MAETVSALYGKQTQNGIGGRFSMTSISTCALASEFT